MVAGTASLVSPDADVGAVPSDLARRPADADIDSHRLLLRAGYIRRVASGFYSWLPLGRRVLAKVEQIVRDEMDASGAQEVLLPIAQPLELWARTGRDVTYGPLMFRLQDRKETGFCLSPTAEEVITSLVAGEYSSYRDLPVNLYQINWKYRDELRPRFGLLRAREFLMKDAYSFHVDIDDLRRTYQDMYDAYGRVFTRCGLTFRAVEAQAGEIGGDVNHEFMAVAAIGEDDFVWCTSCDYAANVEAARRRSEIPPTAPVSRLGLRCSRTREGAHARPAGHRRRRGSTSDVGAVRHLLKCIAFDVDGEARARARARRPRGQPVRAGAGARARSRCASSPTTTSRPAPTCPRATSVPTSPGAALVVADPLGRAQPEAGWITGANEADYHVRHAVLGRDFHVDAVGRSRERGERRSVPALRVGPLGRPRHRGGPRVPARHEVLRGARRHLHRRRRASTTRW